MEGRKCVERRTDYYFSVCARDRISDRYLAPAEALFHSDPRLL